MDLAPEQENLALQRMPFAGPVEKEVSHKYGACKGIIAAMFTEMRRMLGRLFSPRKRHKSTASSQRWRAHGIALCACAIHKGHRQKTLRLHECSSAEKE